MPSLSSVSAPHYTPQRFRAFALCVLLAAAAATSSSCARAGRKDYFPLSAGARWEYSGRLSSPSGQFGVPVTIHTEGETIIRGKRYLKYVIASDLSAVTKSPRRSEEVRYYRAAEDGVYFLRGQDTGGDEVLEMPLPTPIGVSWLSGAAEVRAERAGTVRAGGREYADCLKVTHKGAVSGRRVENYLAPGVGLVRAVFADVVGPGSNLELTLTKYER